MSLGGRAWLAFSPSPVAFRAEDAVQRFLVALERRSSLARETKQGQRDPALVGLFHLDVAGFFQLRDVAGEVALCQRALAEHQEEVRLLYSRKERDDEEAGGVVYDAIEFGHSPSPAGSGGDRRNNARRIAPTKTQIVPRPRNSQFMASQPLVTLKMARARTTTAAASAR